MQIHRETTQVYVTDVDELNLNKKELDTALKKCNERIQCLYLGKTSHKM